MKMKLTLKRILTSILAGVMLLGAIFMTSGCKEKKPQGEIYTLSSAYDKGYITREELLSIAYYNNDKYLNPEIDENFQPIEKGELDEEAKLMIQESIAYLCRNVDTGQPDTIDKCLKLVQTTDVTIINYFGRYENCYVFSFFFTDCFCDSNVGRVSRLSLHDRRS